MLNTNRRCPNYRWYWSAWTYSGFSSYVYVCMHNPKLFAVLQISFVIFYI